MSQHRKPSNPMLAQAAEAVSNSSSRITPELPPSPSIKKDPNLTADEVLGLLSEEQFRSARSLAAEAIALFPDNPRIQGIWAIFETRGKATVGSGGPQPNRKEEFAWLRNPPAWARGKWVALVGEKVVAAADTLAEVGESLRSKTFDRTPLVHQVD